MSDSRLYPQALQLHRQGQFAQAEALYREILKSNPQDADSLHYLGLLCYQTERMEEAKKYLQIALEIQPNNTDLMQHFALCLRDTGDAQGAISLLQQASKLAPHDADISHNLANTYWHMQAYAEAAHGFSALLAQHRSAEIQESLLAVLFQWGDAAHQQGDYQQAQMCFSQALVHAPSSVELLYNLANAERELGLLPAAKQHYQQALALAPTDADIHNNLGNVERELGNLDIAIQHYQQAIQLNPSLGHALVHLIHQKQHICDWQDLDAQVTQVRSWVQQGQPMQIAPFAFLAMPNTSAQEQRLCANLWTKTRLQAWTMQAQPYQHRWQHKKIRLGYLSADFRQHPLAYLVSEVLERHDRNQFSLYAYSSGKDDQSPERQRFMQAFEHFHDIRTMGIRQAADLIHRDEIDILIDLTGYTQNSRAQIVALKPSKVSINWLGFPGTMGNDLYDYMIGDPIVTPMQMQACYAEKVLNMPHCYQPNDTQRPKPQSAQRADFGLPQEALVFACFNQTFKILPQIFACWMRILHSVPNSVLWLLQCNTWAQNNLIAAAAAQGIDASRLIFAERVDMQTHMSRMALADLFLDTLPYNAHTSASDALWAGLPVLTCMGDTFAARVGASLLQAIDMPELICADLPTYERKAIALGTDRSALMQLKQKLANQRQQTPLFDSQQFCQDLEQLYQKVLPN